MWVGVCKVSGLCLGIGCVFAFVILLIDADCVCMYAHMLELQGRNDVLERCVERQADALQRLQQQQQQHQPQHETAGRAQYFDPLSSSSGKVASHARHLAPPNENDDDHADDDNYDSSSDGFDSEPSALDQSPSRSCAGGDDDADDAAGDTAAREVQVDTTDALAGAAREALRIDPCAGDAAAHAVLLQRVLDSCLRRMCVQEQLLQIASSAAAPSASSASAATVNEKIVELQSGLIAAVAIAQSLIHDNAAIRADAAERDAQVVHLRHTSHAPQTTYITRCTSNVTRLPSHIVCSRVALQVVSAVAAFLHQHARDLDSLQTLAGARMCTEHQLHLSSYPGHQVTVHHVTPVIA